jgi:hypothetical protein
MKLSFRIATNTASLHDYLISHGLPTTSFDVDGPLDSLIPKEEVEVEAALVALVDDMQELRRLVLGPRDHLMSFSVGFPFLG